MFWALLNWPEEDPFFVSSPYLTICSVLGSFMWSLNVLMLIFHKDRSFLPVNTVDYFELRPVVFAATLWDNTWDSVEKIAKLGPCHYNRFSSMEFRNMVSLSRRTASWHARRPSFEDFREQIDNHNLYTEFQAVTTYRVTSDIDMAKIPTYIYHTVSYIGGILNPLIRINNTVQHILNDTTYIFIVNTFKSTESHLEQVTCAYRRTWPRTSWLLSDLTVLLLHALVTKQLNNNHVFLFSM